MYTQQLTPTLSVSLVIPKLVEDMSPSTGTQVIAQQVAHFVLLAASFLSNSNKVANLLLLRLFFRAAQIVLIFAAGVYVGMKWGSISSPQALHTEYSPFQFSELRQLSATSDTTGVTTFAPFGSDQRAIEGDLQSAVRSQKLRDEIANGLLQGGLLPDEINVHLDALKTVRLDEQEQHVLESVDQPFAQDIERELERVLCEIGLQAEDVQTHLGAFLDQVQPTEYPFQETFSGSVRQIKQELSAAMLAVGLLPDAVEFHVEAFSVSDR
jgi:hypothetical protein